MVASRFATSLLPTVASMVPQALQGRWSGNVSTGILGPIAGADFAEDFLLISQASEDGSFYVRHTKEAQLFRIQERRAQYCFAYSLGMPLEAPFEVNSTSESGMTLCWRGERLPTHKAGCHGCDCAQWSLTLENDVLRSVFMMSPPVIHLQMDLVRSGAAPSSEYVRDGWNCVFEDMTGKPMAPPLGCPVAATRRASGPRPPTLPSVGQAEAKCVRLNAVTDLRLQYQPASLPCMPCKVAFMVSIAAPEDGYVAIGFKDTAAAYANSSVISEIPGYLGMSTDTSFGDAERWASVSGRIVAGHLAQGKGCFREMRSEQYVGAPVDAQGDGGVQDAHVQWASGRLSLSFTVQMNLGQNAKEADWATGILGELRVMWAAGQAPDSCTGPLGYHQTQRAVANLAFPGYGSPCEQDMLSTDLIV